MIDKNNYHIETAANFTSCPPPNEEPDYVSDSGSRYWRRDTGVIRQSDHWGFVASCLWLKDGEESSVLSAGFCAWSDFRPMAEKGTLPPIQSYLDRLEAELEEKCREWERQLETKREEQRLLVSGQPVTCLRTYTTRERYGRFKTHRKRIAFTVARETPCYVIADDGRKYAKHTLSEVVPCNAAETCPR
jgi:hypothetical protein